MKSLYLENESLKVEVLPEYGGKIRSILNVDKNFDFVAENTHMPYGHRDINTRFEDSDASGLDDAFPNIDAETIVFHNRSLEYTDHGEIWRSSFVVEQETKKEISLLYKSEEKDYVYRKNICLENNKVIISYHIENLSEEVLPCVWTFHGLFRYEEDMEFVYPKGTMEFENVANEEILGEVGTIYSIDYEGYDFKSVPKMGSNEIKKFYVNGKVTEGYCAYRYPHQGMMCEMTFDQEKLPYLGLWITAGGFRGDYNCAFEPSNGYYDSVSNAMKNHAIYYLEKGKPLDFNLELLCKEII